MGGTRVAPMSKRVWGQADRREDRRVKSGIDAICVIDGSIFRARIFDLSWSGMTLLTGPRVPRATHLQVQCQLESGATATFEMEEIQRRSLHRGEFQFQRLGLRLISASSEGLDLFHEIAVKKATEAPESPVERPSPSHAKTRESRGLAPPGASGDNQDELSLRNYRRLTFQLPVLARVEGRQFRCHTMDISLRGLSLKAPEDFPKTEAIFPLSYSEPDGDEISLRVRETYRKPLDAPHRGWRIGLNAVGGSREFRRFLEKHNLWGTLE